MNSILTKTVDNKTEIFKTYNLRTKKGTLTLKVESFNEAIKHVPIIPRDNKKINNQLSLL
jgi:hypothetical protein